MSIGTSTAPRPINPAAKQRSIAPNHRALFSGTPEETPAAPTFGLNTVSFGDTRSGKRPLTPQFGPPSGEVGRRLNFLA